MLLLQLLMYLARRYILHKVYVSEALSATLVLTNNTTSSCINTLRNFGAVYDKLEHPIDRSSQTEDSPIQNIWAPGRELCLWTIIIQGSQMVNFYMSEIELSQNLSIAMNTFKRKYLKIGELYHICRFQV